KHPTNYLYLISNPSLLYNKLLRNFEITGLPIRMRAGPTHFFIEVSSHCNLKCIICERGLASDINNRGRNMPSELFNTVLPDLRFAHRINFFASGEPFLNPNLTEFISRIPDHRIFKSIFTNGVSPNIRDCVSEIFKAGIREIAFSIDAATPETYRKIRVGGEFSKVWETLQTVVVKRENFRSPEGVHYPQININFVLMKSNLHELPQLISKLAKFNIDYFRVMHLDIINESLESESVGSYESEVKKILEQCIELCDESGIKLCLPLNNPLLIDESLHAMEYSELARIPYKGFCFEPWRSLIIKSDGSVPICCYNDEPIGNVNNSSIKQIWNTEKMQRLRTLLKSGNQPVRCKHCPRFAESSVPYYKYKNLPYDLVDSGY
ncbi:MAG: hypothetical protein A2161_04390, partial [Candidatus Schekmanbacteria bacterium RBG_13_48_7]